MESNELYEMRKKIADWKNQSGKIMLNIFTILEKSSLKAQAINESKIMKTLKTFLNSNVDDDFKEAVSKGKDLYKRMKSVVENKTTEKLQQLEKKAEETIKRQTSTQSNTSAKTNTNLPQIDLFQNYKEEPQNYISRKPYLTLISKQIILNIQNSKDQENNEMNQQELCKVQDLVVALEKEFFYKNRYKNNPRTMYEGDMKTLIQYLKRDKNGSLTLKLISGAFSINQAAQLKSNDWIDDGTRQQQAKILQEEFEKQQIGFYKQLQKREMMSVEGKNCKGCHQNTVYLVDEKQTRRSDEPTTKFFECFTCGDKYRIC